MIRYEFDSVSKSNTLRVHIITIIIILLIKKYSVALEYLCSLPNFFLCPPLPHHYGSCSNTLVKKQMLLFVLVNAVVFNARNRM